MSKHAFETRAWKRLGGKSASLVLLAALAIAGVNQGCDGGGGSGELLDGSSGAMGGGGDSDGSMGTTATPCQSDKDCRDRGGLCDMARSVCVACLVDTDCATSQMCKGGACAGFTPCDNSKDCPVEQACDGRIAVWIAWETTTATRFSSPR
jgi:hypothetical protein